MDSALSPAVIGVVAGCGACIGFPLMLLVVWLIVRKSSGWNKLAAAYPATTSPEGQPYTRQCIGVGKAEYMQVATVHIGPAGLRLSLPLTKSGDVLVPWQQVTAVGPTQLGSAAQMIARRGVELTLAGPPDCPVALDADLLEAIRPHLQPGIIPDNLDWS